jgi:hypothetical protein
VGRCGLQLRAAIDLFDRGHDFGRGAGQLLDRRRKLLGHGADLFGRGGVGAASAQGVGQSGERARRRLALL